MSYGHTGRHTNNQQVSALTSVARQLHRHSVRGTTPHRNGPAGYSGPEDETMTTRNWTDAIECLNAAREDIDGVPTVRIRAAYRDLNSKLTGPEEFRRVAYAPRAGDIETEWPDSDRLPAASTRAGDRCASVSCSVPVGTLVQRFSRDVFRGQRGRCSVAFALVVQSAKDPARGALIELKHRTLRARPVYEITLPTGELCFVRRKDA